MRTRTLRRGPRVPSLFGKTLTLVTDVATVDDEFLAVNRLQRETLQARGWNELGWVEVAVRQCLYPDDSHCAIVLQDMMDFHASVATNIAAHLQLVFQNVIRTSWLAGQLLATNPAVAQRAARELHGKLMGLGEAQRTSFEKAFSDEGRLELLASFADRAVPVVRWRGEGYYAKLYRWLAVRFLGNVDNVLECESVHAQWQWIETVAHAIKLKQLNAVLLLRSWMQQHGQLPGHDELLHHLDPTVSEARRRYNIVCNGGLVAAGQRAEQLYLDASTCWQPTVPPSAPVTTHGPSRRALRFLS